MRLSVQMKKILLILLKTETDLKFLPLISRSYDTRCFQITAANSIGEITNEEMEKMLAQIPPKLTKVDIIQCIKPSAVEVKTVRNPWFTRARIKRLVYVRGSVDISVSRSLKRLIELGLVDVMRKVSPGRHGYLYSLTHKGRATATKIRQEIQNTIQEFQSFL